MTPKRRIWPWLGGAALCLLAGYAGMRARMTPGAPQTARTLAQPLPSPGVGQPAPVSHVSGSLATVPSTSPTPEAAGGRTQEAWLTLLASLAGEGYAHRHPGVLEKLAALLVAHPGDEGWEAGAVAYLARGLEGDATVSFWEKAAEALPGNLAVSDKLIRAATLEIPTDGPVSAESLATLEALMARQALRTPKDPQVALLRAWAAFADGRGEDGAVLLNAATGFPAWQEKAGIAEMGGLDVREAVDGPQSPFLRMAVMGDLQLPNVRLTADLGRKVVQSMLIRLTPNETPHGQSRSYCPGFN